MPRRLAIPFATFALLVPTLAYGLGADHPAGPIRNERWPAPLAELANAANRVHGYFVNSADVLFFRGDTPALNAFLATCARLPDTQLKVVLHPGKLDVRSPWDKHPRDLQADWMLYAAPYEEDGARPHPGHLVTRVDVYLGGSVKLDDLRIPASTPVESGGEIESFVKAHPKK
jgi:hypothetical protein